MQIITSLPVSSCMYSTYDTYGIYVYTLQICIMVKILPVPSLQIRFHDFRILGVLRPCSAKRCCWGCGNIFAKITPGLKRDSPGRWEFSIFFLLLFKFSPPFFLYPGHEKKNTEDIPSWKNQAGGGKMRRTCMGWSSSGYVGPSSNRLLRTRPKAKRTKRKKKAAGCGVRLTTISFLFQFAHFCLPGFFTVQPRN